MQKMKKNSKKLDEALKSGKPAVIDAEIFLDEMVYPMIPPGKSVEYLIME